MVRQLLLSLSIVTLAACAAPMEGEGTEDTSLSSGGKADTASGPDAQSRTLTPPIARAAEWIGRPIADGLRLEIAATTLVEARTAHDYFGSDCTFAEYAGANRARVTHVRCSPGAELIEVLIPPQGGARYFDYRRYLDLDLDGRIDERATHGRSEHDEDRDGRMDLLTEAVATPIARDGFDRCWTPPAHPGERMLEDRDGDGLFDTETVTSGRAPDGTRSVWTRTCP